jgi:hypothetical protein
MMGLQFGTQRIDRVLNQLPRAKLGDGAKFSNEETERRTTREKVIRLAE